MSFTQTITVRAPDADGLAELMRRWHDEQAGVAPGYRGARLLADRDEPGRYVIEVDFTSLEEAQANNDREATRTWAGRLEELVEDAPAYGNFDVAFTTG